MPQRNFKKVSQDQRFAEARRRRLAGEPVKQRRAQSAAAREVIVMDIEVTTEPIPEDGTAGQAIADILNDDDRLRLFEEIHQHPEQTLAELKQLSTRYPDCGTLQNWYAGALKASGKYAEAEVVTAELVERFPRYLFAVMSYLGLLLDRKDAAAAEELLRGRFALTQLIPNRRRFHISEVTTYICAMFQYQMLKDRPDAARSYLDMLEKLDPQSPHVAYCRRILSQDAMARMREWAGGKS